MPALSDLPDETQGRIVSFLCRLDVEHSRARFRWIKWFCFELFTVYMRVNKLFCRALTPPPKPEGWLDDDKQYFPRQTIT